MGVTAVKLAELSAQTDVGKLNDDVGLATTSTVKEVSFAIQPPPLRFSVTVLSPVVLHVTFWSASEFDVGGVDPDPKFQAITVGWAPVATGVVPSYVIKDDSFRQIGVVAVNAISYGF